MAIEDIIKKINSETEKRIKQIKDKAMAEAGDIIKVGEEKANNLKSSLTNKARLESDEEERRQIALAKLDLRKETLSEKRILIDNLFKEVYSNFSNLEQKNYQNLMKDLLLSYAKSGNEEIIINPKRKLFWTDSFLKDVNKSLFGGANLKLSKEVGKFDDGFILREETFETDCTFETIFKIAKENLETQVAEILFTKE